MQHDFTEYGHALGERFAARHTWAVWAACFAVFVVAAVI